MRSVHPSAKGSDGLCLGLKKRVRRSQLPLVVEGFLAAGATAEPRTTFLSSPLFFNTSKQLTIIPPNGGWKP